MNRRAGNAGIGMSTIREDHFQHRSGSARSSPYWRRFFEVNCMGAFLMMGAGGRTWSSRAGAAS
jgi:hypothetical protein